VFLKQGTLTVRGRGLTAAFGRFEYRDGLEVVPSDPTLAFLAKTRIAERLVGPFDFTHVTRSFDGARVAYDSPDWNVTTFGTRPTWGGFQVSANRELDMELAGLAATLRRLPQGPPLVARLFYLYYRDARQDALKVDNRPKPARVADKDPITINTIGANATTAIDLGPGIVDGLLWGAVQTGTWGVQSDGAWAYAMEAGYQMPQIPRRPGCGSDGIGRRDNNPNDGVHRTFFQLIPTARTYARLPFFNLMNSNDVFFGAAAPAARSCPGAHRLPTGSGSPTAAILLVLGRRRVQQHVLRLCGEPANGNRALATLADISVTVALIST
jgi:hypothetical protein